MRRKTEPPSLMELVRCRAAEGHPNQGKSLATVLPLSGEIKEVLAAGYGWKIVWQALTDAGRIDMGYDTFRYTCRFCGLSTLKDRSPLAPSLHRTWLNGSSPVASMVAGDESRNGEVSNIGY